MLTNACCCTESSRAPHAFGGRGASGADERALWRHASGLRQHVAKLLCAPGRTNTALKLVGALSAGNPTVEPADVPKDALASLRRASGCYVAQSGKLVLPLKYFGLKEDDNSLPPRTSSWSIFPKEPLRRARMSRVPLLQGGVANGPGNAAGRTGSSKAKAAASKASSSWSRSKSPQGLAEAGLGVFFEAFCEAFLARIGRACLRACCSSWGCEHAGRKGNSALRPDGLPSYITDEAVKTAQDMQKQYGHPAGCTLRRSFRKAVRERGFGPCRAGQQPVRHKWAASSRASPAWWLR